MALQIFRKLPVLTSLLVACLMSISCRSDEKQVIEESVTDSLSEQQGDDGSEGVVPAEEEPTSPSSIGDPNEGEPEGKTAESEVLAPETSSPTPPSPNTSVSPTSDSGILKKNNDAALRPDSMVSEPIEQNSLDDID